MAASAAPASRGRISGDKTRASGAQDSEFAPAKVNLTLRLCGQRADGYHLLDSLVVFPRIGDRLWAEPCKAGLSLAMDGPHCAGLDAGAGNLVLRAAEALSIPGMPGASLRLEKNLPVASGIGGGSSDAAAALRLLGRLWGRVPGTGVAAKLGADVPVCLQAPTAARMSGIGEQIAPLARFPACWTVLVNPLRSVETRAVFAGTPDKSPPPTPDFPAEGFADFAGLAAWLGTQRNDLMPAALRLCPPIRTVLDALGTAPVRGMSGSGATCFALFPQEAQALSFADNLRAGMPGWWVAAGPIAAQGN